MWLFVNTGKKEEIVKINYYSERTSGFSKMKNIETSEISPLKDFSLMPMESGVWELEK
jgi:hypothetical protein